MTVNQFIYALAAIGAIAAYFAIAILASRWDILRELLRVKLDERRDGKKANLVFCPCPGGRGWLLKNLGPGHASNLYVAELDAFGVFRGAEAVRELAPNQTRLLPKELWRYCMTLVVKYHDGRFKNFHKPPKDRRKLSFCRDGEMSHDSNSSDHFPYIGDIA